eukprot:jgi/Chrzof1/1591/Cz10g13190.t1
MSQDTSPPDTLYTPDSSPDPSIKFKEPWTVSVVDNLRSFGTQLVCAGGSGAIAKTAVAPLERIKILLQVQRMSAVPPAEQYKGLWDGLRRIPAREGGIRALYRGNGANVLRLVPEVAFKHMLHDQFKIMFSPPDGGPLGVQQKAAAAASTGLLRTLMFYPLEFCRTRITADTTPAGQPRANAGIVHCLRTAWAQEGILSWYKGLGLSLPGVVMYTSTSLLMYDEYKSLLPADNHSKDMWWYPFAKMGCGAAAGVTAQTLTYPLDTLRRRMQMNGGPGQAVRYKGYVDCLRKMLQTEGGLSLFRGLGINCVKTVPGAAVHFLAYDLLRLGITMVDPTSGAVSPL